MQIPVAQQDHSQEGPGVLTLTCLKIQSQENMKNPHTRTKPQADRTLSEEDTTAHCLHAMSNTKPDRASFALGMAAPPPRRVMNSPKAATNLWSPNCSPRVWMNSPQVTPFRTKDTLCSNSAAIHRSCGAPNRSCCSLLSSTAKGKLGTPGGLGGNGGEGSKSWRENIDGVIKWFFHNLGQHLCLLLQFHCPLLLLCLLFLLLILQTLLLQQFSALP